MHTSEIEQTAQLSKSEFDRLKAYFAKNLKHTSSQKRFMVRFIEDKIDVRNPIDIRYKCTNGAHELVIKKGALGSQKRKELSIPLAGNQLDHFIHLFSLMGFKKGLAMYREIERYENENIEVALGIAHPYYYMEAESMNSTKKSIALEHIKNFFNEINVKPFSKSEYHSFLRMTDREVNLKFPLDTFPQSLNKIPYWKSILSTI